MHVDRLPSLARPADGPAVQRGQARPRLTVIHLLVWVLLCAFAAARQRIGLSAWPSTTIDAEVVAWLTLWIIGEATVFAGFLVLPLHWHRKIPFPVWPGEWLWTAQACRFGFGTVVAESWHQLAGHYPSWFLGHVWPFEAVVAGLVVALGAVRCRLQRPWAWALWLVVLVHAVEFALRWRLSSPTIQAFLGARLNPWPSWLNLADAAKLAIPIVLLAMVADACRRRAPSPWTHWVGCAAFVGLHAPWCLRLVERWLR